jgi:hypothetical protein
VLIGFEEGGTLAAMFAAGHPDRASALILFSPWVKGSWSSDYPWPYSGDDELAEWNRHLDEWGTEAFTRWNIGLADPGMESDDRWVADWTRYFRSCASPGMMQAIDAMNQATDARAILPTVSAPTLTLQRTEDTMGSLDEVRYITSLIPGARMVELPGTAHAPYRGDVDSVVREVEGFLSGVHREEAEFDRSLASVLFTDVVGSTARAAELGDREWSELIERHHAIVRAMLTRYRGKEIDTAGDGFFATFDGPARAVRCAQQIMEALEPTDLEIRAGVHTGEVRTIDRKVGGLGVGDRRARGCARRCFGGPRLPDGQRPRRWLRTRVRRRGRARAEGCPRPSSVASVVTGVRPAASLYAAVRSDFAWSATASAACTAPPTKPGGKPVAAEPG